MMGKVAVALTPVPPFAVSRMPRTWLTAVASLLVGAAFFALWGSGCVRDGSVSVVALRCAWDFGWTGRGTPAPVAAPQRLVVGFYRYVRNPMYIGFAAAWIGLWNVFGHANPAEIAVVAAVALGVHLFVVFYEEPTLRKKFGEGYEEYCRNVNRWSPRERGWDGRR